MKSIRTAWACQRICESLNRNIVKNMKENFKKVYLTHNLAKTIYSEIENPINAFYIYENVSVWAPPSKLIAIHVPAVRYDLDKWYKDHVVVHTPEKGSYAQEVDIKGGFSGLHRGYVEQAIISSILPSIKSAGYGMSKICKIRLKGVKIR